MLDRPGVAAVIVGARYARTSPRTSPIADLALDAGDRAAIDAVLAGAAAPRATSTRSSATATGRHGAIMKYNLNRGAA